MEKELKNTRRSSPGNDLIIYDFLKNMNNENKQKLLKFFNFLWI